MTHNTLPRKGEVYHIETINSCVDIALRNGINLGFQGEKYVYLLEHNLTYVKPACDFFKIEIPKVEPYDSQAVFCILAYGPVGYGFEPFKSVQGISIQRGISTYADLVPDGVNKYEGIRKIPYIGDEPSYIAFGDSLNDYDMLLNAQLSVAMGQASIELKRISDYVTRPVSEDGIFHACMALDLI